MQSLVQNMSDMKSNSWYQFNLKERGDEFFDVTCIAYMILLVRNP